jgi:hypothetical protein
MTFLRTLSFAVFVTSAGLSGCSLPAASIPDQTWRPGEEQGCTPRLHGAPSRGDWPKRDQLALRAKLEEGEVAVVSSLGCRVEVLKHCAIDGELEEQSRAHAIRFERASGSLLARDLEGACPDATHVVDEATFDQDGRLLDASLRPLSLAGVDLSGSWEGVARQPYGPYTKYDVRLDLRQTGDVVTGTTEIATPDGENWGRIKLEGKLDGTKLYFADVAMLDEDVDLFLAWCMKGGYAVIDPREGLMKGPWRAMGCSPGTIELDRAPR